jgi:hypothetical protein
MALVITGIQDKCEQFSIGLRRKRAARLNSPQVQRGTYLN